MDAALGGEAQQTPRALRLGTGWNAGRDAAGGGLLDAGENLLGALPGLGLGVGQDGASGKAETHLVGIAAGGGDPIPHVGDALGDGGPGLAPQGEEVGAAAGHVQGDVGGAAEEQRQVGTLAAASLAVGVLEVVELAVVVEGFRFGPDATHHGEVFVGAAVAGVMVEPVAVLPLLQVVAAGDDVQGDAPVAELVQGGGLAGGEGRGDEAGAMGDEVAQPLGVGGGVAGDFKAVGGGGRVAGEHHIEAGRLVGAGEVEDIVGVNAGGDFGAGVDAAAEEAEGCALIGGGLADHANHSDDGYAVVAVHTGKSRGNRRGRRDSVAADIAHGCTCLNSWDGASGSTLPKGQFRRFGRLRVGTARTQIVQNSSENCRIWVLTSITIRYTMYSRRWGC